MASLSSAADVVNVALVRIGWKNQVGDLRDGSEAAQLALALYGQTRDAMMRDGDYGFCQRSGPLTLLKQAPADLTYLAPWTDAYPPLPWIYEYDYLPDMLKLRSVKPTPVFIPNFDPQPYIWQIDNDNSYTPAKRVILCNVKDAMAVYAARVTDPSTWPPDFAEALIDALGQGLSPALAKMEQAQMEAAEGSRDTLNARMEQG